MKKFFLFFLAGMLSLPSLVSHAQVFQSAFGLRPVPWSVAPDNFGNTYVGGYFGFTDTVGTQVFTSTGQNDSWVGKFDASWNLLWMHNGGNSGNDQGVMVKGDNNGGVYFVLYFSGTLTWGANNYTAMSAEDYLLIHYDALGNELWTKQFSPVYAVDNNLKMQLDAAGNLEVMFTATSQTLNISGTNYNGGPGYNLFLITLTPAGTVQNVMSLAHSGSSFFADGNTIDASGNIYFKTFTTSSIVTGGTTINGGTTFGHILVKLSPAGALLWHKELDYYGGPSECLATDAAGNLTFTGDWDTYANMVDTSVTQTGPVSDDVFVLHYDANGNYLWGRFFGSATGSESAPYALVNSQGDIDIVGVFGGAMSVGSYNVNCVGTNDIYVAKFSAAGQVQWVMPSHSPNYEALLCATLDPFNNVCIGGGTSVPYNFGLFNFGNGNRPFFVVSAADNACQTLGKVFKDFNNNGNPDPTDAGLANVIVDAGGGNYSLSGNDGDFQLFTVPGNYTLSIPNPPLYYTLTTAATQSASFTALGQVDSTNDFGFYPTPHIRDLRINITDQVPARPNKIASFIISYQNVGTDTALNGSAGIHLPAGLNYNWSTPLYDWISGMQDSLSWNFTNLLPGETRYVQVYVHVTSTAVQGTQFPIGGNVTATGNTEYTPADNVTLYPMICITSFDPNEKEVYPSAVPESYVTADTNYFNYKIRFQNTGSDTAFDIIVRDTLDANLNIGSFELVSASAPVSIQIRNPRCFDFIFHGINLPDSGTNEMRSHGMIAFRIKANANMSLPNIINNRASIYFDYNAPVPTNVAAILIGNTLVENTDQPLPDLQLFPNPSNGQVWVNIQHVVAGAVYTLQLCDLSGRVLASLPAEGGKTLCLNLPGLPTGMYLMNLMQNGINMGSRKLAVCK